MIKMNENETLYEKTLEVLEQGNFDEAKKLLIELRRKEETPEKNFLISKLLIEFGIKTSNQKYFNEAIGKLKQLREYDFHRLHFYLGNAYLKKYESLKEKPDYLNDPEKLLYNAKLEFKKEIDNNPDELLHGALVNLGAIYNKIGRTVEALENYDIVCKEFGSDYGIYNKGHALYSYSTFTDNPTLCIKEAYFHFKLIIEDPNLKSKFKNPSKNMIELILEKYDIEFLEEKIENEGKIEIPAGNDFEFYIVKYCFENDLNLNFCDYCKKCKKSIEDSLVIEKMIYEEPKSGNETSFSMFSSYLNQIKMDYVSARTLLILSEYNDFDLDSITKHVFIVNTDFPEETDIRVQLLKDSFKNFFNILDKIAFFIKDYLDFEDKYDNITFRTLWDEPELKKVLIKKSNLGLTALYDIHMDIDKTEEKKNLRKTRNDLTHKYLKITIEQQEITDKTVEELKAETLEIAHIVKNAIIYLMRFVKINEENIEDALDVEFIPIEEVEF